MLTSEVRESLNFYFQKPCRAIFSGSSQSGKTYLVGKILEDQRKLFNDEFQQIIYYYFRVIKCQYSYYALFLNFWSFVQSQLISMNLQLIGTIGSKIRKCSITVVFQKKRRSWLCPKIV